jgi:hypothetical protein
MNANRLAGGVLRGVGWRRGVLLDWSGYFCLPWVSESSSSRGLTALVLVCIAHHVSKPHVRGERRLVVVVVVVDGSGGG